MSSSLKLLYLFLAWKVPHSFTSLPEQKAWFPLLIFHHVPTFWWKSWLIFLVHQVHGQVHPKNRSSMNARRDIWLPKRKTPKKSTVIVIIVIRFPKDIKYLTIEKIANNLAGFFHFPWPFSDTPSHQPPTVAHPTAPRSVVAHGLRHGIHGGPKALHNLALVVRRRHGDLVPRPMEDQQPVPIWSAGVLE